jgi:hypothetical protein
MIHDAQLIAIMEHLPIHLQSGTSEFWRCMETVRKIIIVPVVTQVQVDTGWVKGMKELPVLFVGTQRGTNPGSRVHTTVWRTHLVRVILSQNLREFGIKRLEYFGLRATLEFGYVILCNRNGHGT